MTFVLITRDELLRADLPRGSADGVRLAREVRPPVDDLSSLVEAALRLSPERPAAVWVLATDLWTQTLALTAGSVAGLEPERLARALGFEAEPYSGISGIEARAGYIALPASAGDREFWITVLPESQLQQIEFAVTQAGGRLAGVAHPGGLPRTLADEAPPAWRRIELWPGALVGVTGGSDVAPRVDIINGEPRSGRWSQDIQRWNAPPRAELALQWLLATSGVPRAEMPAEDGLDLSAPGGAERLLAAWAGELAAAQPRVPVIFPARRPMSVAARRGLSIGVALLCAAVCTGHYWFVEMVRTRQVAETARLRRPAEQVQQIKKEADALRTKRDKLQGEYDKLSGDVTTCRQTLLAQRLRVARLMELLAKQPADEFLLEKIESTADHVVLHGLALRPEAVNLLARALNAELEPLGWRVQTPKNKAQELLVGGGPWKFELSLDDAPPAMAPRPQATAATGNREAAL